MLNKFFPVKPVVKEKTPPLKCGVLGRLALWIRGDTGNSVARRSTVAPWRVDYSRNKFIDPVGLRFDAFCDELDKHFDSISKPLDFESGLIKHGTYIKPIKISPSSDLECAYQLHHGSFASFLDAVDKHTEYANYDASIAEHAAKTAVVIARNRRRIANEAIVKQAEARKIIRKYGKIPQICDFLG